MLRALTSCPIIFGFVLLISQTACKKTYAFDIDASLARLNHAGFRTLNHCTATLIAPHAALTAKHCVKSDQHLLFGYQRGEWLEHRRVSETIEHPDNDMAILCFKKRSEQTPIAVNSATNLRIGSLVSVFGYPRSKSHLPERKTCKILTMGQRTLLNCPLEFGMSGGPVLTQTKGVVKIIGVASTTSEKYSIIELVNPWIDKTANQCPIE